MASRRKFVASENAIVANMQKYVKQCDYVEALEYFEEHRDEVSGEDLGELYLSLAQAKLFACDETVLDDLKAAKHLLPEGSRVTTIGTVLEPSSPHTFIVFNSEAGALNRYRVILRKAAPILKKLCGGMSGDIIWAYEAEMLYYTGYIQKALEIAEPLWAHTVKNNYYMLAYYVGHVLIRCYISTADSEKMETTLSQLIRYSKILSIPRNRILYNYINDWINCTTGWMGEVPRFIASPNGIEQPMLDDRISMMNGVMAAYSKVEESYIQLAKHQMARAYSIKEVCSNLYEAVILYKLGRKNHAASLFYDMYSITQKNRIIMPFVEYGAQILPLMQYALSRKDGERFARRWSDKLHHMATKYEESLRVIRGEANNDELITKSLSELELYILKKLVLCMTMSEIAESLDMTLETVKQHIRGLYKKIGVHNRSEAVAKALGGRIVSMDELESARESLEIVKKSYR